MERYSLGAPATEIEARIAALQKAMSAQGIDGSLILQKTDLFYFTGTAQQGWLYVPVAGAALLMIFKDVDRASLESPLAVLSLVSPKKMPEILREMGCPAPTVLGMELDVLPTNLYFQYAAIFKEARIVDVATEIRLIRAVKSTY